MQVPEPGLVWRLWAARMRVPGHCLDPGAGGKKGAVLGGGVIWLESFRSPCRLPKSAERSGGHCPNFSSRFYLLLSCPEFAWLFFKQTLGILSDSLALLVSPWNRWFIWTLKIRLCLCEVKESLSVLS